MAGDRLTEIPIVFYRTAAGAEPVRDGCGACRPKIAGRLGPTSRPCKSDGRLACTLCRSLGTGLWEVRSTLANKRIARLIFFVTEGRIGVLHGFIKKTQKTPPAEIALAKKRMKEMMK